MIHILCYSCSTHLANTDVARLDWPLTGEMFSVVYPGWYLRPGPLNLEIFCPACEQFPFSHDPYTAGGNAVGKNLNVRWADSKSVVMTVKQILMGDGFREPAPLSQAEQLRGFCEVVYENGGGGLEKPQQSEAMSSRAVGGQDVQPDGKPAFPCPHCGAKKRFHKKGCLLTTIEGNGNRMAQREVEWIKNSLHHDPHLLAMEARVSSGPERGEIPTAAEIADLERGREARRERVEPVLRPGEGWAPKAAK